MVDVVSQVLLSGAGVHLTEGSHNVVPCIVHHHIKCKVHPHRLHMDVVSIISRRVVKDVILIDVHLLKMMTTYVKSLTMAPE